MPDRSLTRGTLLLLVLYAALSLAAALPLYLDSERTDRSFAWTIQPPLTAAFLGAAYASSFVLYVLARRDGIWAQVRMILPAGFVFTTLILVATLLHLERFHLDSSDEAARTVSWIWVTVYVVVPPLTLAFLIHQARLSGHVPHEGSALARWIRVALGCQAAVMLAVGVALLVAPRAADRLWPWMLTPLTGRAVGAWLVGIGFIVAHAAWEGVLRHVRPVLVSYAGFATLEGVALARYPGTLDWSDVRTWAYVVFLLGMLAVGVLGSIRASRIPRARAA